MYDEERIIWFFWISVMFILFGFWWACWHFLCMVIYAGGVNYLRHRYPSPV